MGEPLHPTPYAGVNAALHDFEARIRAIVGDHFCGMYLSGSLALGDFDPRSSDIDFVVVTDTALPEDVVETLRDMHALFDAGRSAWAGKLEAVYIPQDALRRYTPTDARYPQVEKGRT